MSMVAALRINQHEQFEKVEQKIQTSPTAAKMKYASGKCRDAVRDCEHEVSAAITKEVVEKEPPRHKMKVVVLGNSGVGKTSMIYQHRFGTVPTPFNATIGASFISCDADVEEERLEMQIWDTAGQERFRCMVPMYMRNAAAAIIVYDVTSRTSFDDVDRWANDLSRCCGVDDPLLVLVGNKCDMESKRVIARGEGFAKALKLDAKFYEISAFDNTAINPVLSDLAADLVLSCSSSASSTPAVSDTVPLASDDVQATKRRELKCCALL